MLKRGRGQVHSTKAVKECSESQSQTIQDATVTLLGLSYGEHDEGEQRQKISDTVCVILQEWTSGLLTADHAPSEVDAVANAFEKLVLSPVSSRLFLWCRIPLAVIDDLVSLHWKLAYRKITDVSDDETTFVSSEQLETSSSGSLPTAKAMRSLQVALYLLDRTIDSESQRRCAAVNNSLEFFIFAAYRLRLSSRLFSSPSDEAIEDILSPTLKHIFRMRHVDSAERLISHILIPLISVAQKAITKETHSQTPHHVLEPLALAPTVDVLYDLVDAVSDIDRLQAVLPNLLAMLYPLVEHVHVGTRVSGLDVLTVLKTRLPRTSFELHAGKFSSHLPSALLWNDPPSTTRAIPLLADVLSVAYTDASGKPPPLSERANSDWQSAFTTILKTIYNHIDQSFPNRSATAQGGADRELGGTDCCDHASAAARLAPLVADLAQHRLLPHTKAWFQGMSRLLPRIVVLVLEKSLPCLLITSVSDAIIHAAAYTWCRCSVFRPPLFAACIACIMEVRRSDEETRLIVHEAVSSILTQLANIDHVELLKLTRSTRRTAEKYKSLEPVAKFLSGIESRGFLKPEPADDDGAQRASEPGAILAKFFGRAW